MSLLDVSQIRTSAFPSAKHRERTVRTASNAGIVAPTLWAKFLTCVTSLRPPLTVKPVSPSKLLLRILPP